MESKGDLQILEKKFSWLLHVLPTFLDCTCSPIAVRFENPHRLHRPSHTHHYVITMSIAPAVVPLRIGMFGGGVVGGGVYEILMQRGVATLRRPVVISKICVRNLDKPRSFTIDESQTTLTTDPNDILEDSEIDCVVEVMGGIGLAKQVVLDSLKAGKSVVTANKALLAAHLDECHDAAKSTKKELAYEAAVCGGIPIIQVLQSCYDGDVITNVSGICNGTTNYMLTAMEDGADYATVLQEAQDLGFAEADPTADVEGHDVRAKIAILAKLAFGQTVSVDDIPTAGISNIQAVDFEYAALLHSTIKLVGTARRLTGVDGDDANSSPLSVYVSPVMVSTKDMLASTRGSGNAIVVTSENMNACSYTGPGAGRFPTANSVVADIVRVANGQASVDPFPKVSPEPLELEDNYVSPFYVRIPFRDGLGIIRQTGELAERHGVSIHAILQNPIADPGSADFCVTTDPCPLSNVQAFCNDLAAQNFCRDPPLHMPLLR